VKPICVKCSIQMRTESNGVNVIEMAESVEGPCQVWKADLHKCPECGYEVVSGYAEKSFTQHFYHGFKEEIERIIASGERIIYNHETRGGKIVTDKFWPCQRD
jgi:hypothetical protein